MLEHKECQWISKREFAQNREGQHCLVFCYRTVSGEYVDVAVPFADDYNICRHFDMGKTVELVGHGYVTQEIGYDHPVHKTVPGVKVAFTLFNCGVYTPVKTEYIKPKELAHDPT